MLKGHQECTAIVREMKGFARKNAFLQFNFLHRDGQHDPVLRSFSSKKHIGYGKSITGLCEYHGHFIRGD